jgi:PhnB protein
MKLYAQLNFGGNCEEAFRFYEKHLGGKVTMMVHQGDLPPSSQPPAGNARAVIHARLDIAGTELLGNDVPAEVFKPIRSAYIYLALDSVEEAERVHALLAEGGEVYMPMAETFFAHRFSMLRDRFGVAWAVINQRAM